MFYLLSFLTAILECGGIFLGIQLGLPLWAVLLFPLAYHIGNLFPMPFTPGKFIVFFAALAAASLEAAAMLTVQPYVKIGLWIGCIFLISLCVQSARSGMKSDNSETLKRVFRTLGFAFSPIMAYTPNMILIIGSLFAFLSFFYTKEKKPRFYKMRSQDGFSVAMICHQLHYFFYAHITLAFIATINSYASIMFAISWVVYLMVKPTAIRCGRTKVLDFVLGHLWIALSLTILSFLKPGVWFYTLWILAGLGGGMVFYIKIAAKEMNCFDKDSNDIAENIGHFAGVAASVLCAFLFIDTAPAIMQRMAAFSALITIPVTIAAEIKGRRLKCK